MTSNLRLELSTSKAVAVVNNETGELAPATPASATQQGAIDGNGMWTPTGSGGTGSAATPMNGNTKYVSTYDSWYYTWYAATAGSGMADMTDEDALYSICPKNWRLPANYAYDKESQAKSFGSLTNVYLGIIEEIYTNTGYQTLEAFPLNFLRAGATESGSYYDTGGVDYWSSTASSTAARARLLGFNTTRVDPQDNYYMHFGFNVRCVSL